MLLSYFGGMHTLTAAIVIFHSHVQDLFLSTYQVGIIELITTAAAAVVEERVKTTAAEM